MFRFKEVKAQVWIETVIYLLIAFIMIGMVLAFVKPKLEDIKDKSICVSHLHFVVPYGKSTITADIALPFNFGNTSKQSSLYNSVILFSF